MAHWAGKMFKKSRLELNSRCLSLTSAHPIICYRVSEDIAIAVNDTKGPGLT